MAKNALKSLIGMHRIINRIDRETARIVKPYDLTLMQFAVLEALLHKGEMTVGQTQEKVLSSSGTIPLIIEKLQKKDLIMRRQCPDDKRKQYLQLTEKGRALIEEVYPKNENMILEAFSVLDTDELEQLTGLLSKMKEMRLS